MEVPRTKQAGRGVEGGCAVLPEVVGESLGEKVMTGRDLEEAKVNDPCLLWRRHPRRSPGAGGFMSPGAQVGPGSLGSDCTENRSSGN